MRPPQGAEWLLILLIVLLLFGGKKLPDMARGLGRSLRILKAETKGLTDDDEAEAQPKALEGDGGTAPVQETAHRDNVTPPSTPS